MGESSIATYRCHVYLLEYYNVEQLYTNISIFRNFLFLFSNTLQNTIFIGKRANNQTKKKNKNKKYRQIKHPHQYKERCTNIDAYKNGYTVSSNRKIDDICITRFNDVGYSNISRQSNFQYPYCQ